MAKYKNTKMTVDNIQEMVQYAAQLQSEKKGIAQQMFVTKFNCSVATAKKILNHDPEAVELMKRAMEVNAVSTTTGAPETGSDENPNIADTIKLRPIAGQEYTPGDIIDYTETTDKNQFGYQLEIQERLGRDVIAALQTETIGQHTLRTLVDMFYQTQNARIRTQSQIRAIEKGFDQSDADTKLLKWTLESDMLKEKGLANALAAITEHEPVCMWLRRIRGIGPIYAAGLRGMLNVNNANYATGFISYAGLNDVNCPWLGKEKAVKVMNETWAELGLKKGNCTVEFMEKLGSKTGRTYTKILSMATTKWVAAEKKTLISETPNAAWLAVNLAKIPYNAELKTLMYKIADRWNKMPTDLGSLYTQIMLTRKQMETEKNERGEFAEYAHKLLAEKKYQDKDLIALLQSGRLPKRQIQLRAYRVAEKVFLSHLFTAMYIFENGKYPPRYYSLDVLGHEDEIFPEVPYDDLFDAYEKRTGLQADRHRVNARINVDEDNLRNRVEKVVKRSWDIRQYIDSYVDYSGSIVDPSGLDMFDT